MYDIVGKRNWFFAISAVLTIPGLLFIILGGLKPSIDFTGGTEWEVRYAEEPSAAEMTAALEDLGYENVVVTELPGGYLRIRTEPIDLLPAVAPVPSPSGSVAPSGSASPSAGASASGSASPSASASPAASPSASASSSAEPTASPEATPVPIAAGTRVRRRPGGARGSVRTRAATARADGRPAHR